MARELILGSSSKPRRMLLERLQLPFTTAHPDIDETPRPNETPQDLVLRLAAEKARKIAESHPHALIISADQVGVLDQHILGKPGTHENAVKQLLAASGKTMDFYIGLCVFDAKNQKQEISLETFSVIYRELSLEQIEKYLAKEEPLECAGSCKAEGLGITLIQEFRGKDFTALIGLPLIRLTEMLLTLHHPIY